MTTPESTAPLAAADSPPDQHLAAKEFRTYPVRIACLTRWSDNDMYGHLNNSKYYELFDTAINTWVAESLGPDFAARPTIGVVAESSCRFHSELAFPGPVTIALRVQRLGRSSVTYDLALFDGDAPLDDALSAATGRWVHVYLDRESRVTTPIPEPLRATAEAIGTGGSTNT